MFMPNDPLATCVKGKGEVRSATSVVLGLKCSCAISSLNRLPLKGFEKHSGFSLTPYRFLREIEELTQAAIIPASGTPRTLKALKLENKHDTHPSSCFLSRHKLYYP